MNMEKRNKKDKKEIELWAVPARGGDGCYALAMLGMAVFIMLAVAIILWFRIKDAAEKSVLVVPSPTAAQTSTTKIKRIEITSTPEPTFTLLPTITTYPTYTPQATYTAQATYTRVFTPTQSPTATATAEQKSTASVAERTVTATASPTSRAMTNTPRATSTRSKERLVTPTPRTLATTLYLLRIPTLTPTRGKVYRTNTPAVTRTPIFTASPVSPSLTPTPAGTPAWTMKVISYGQDRWGAPSHTNGCDGPYNNKRPTQRFRMEVVVQNNSDRALFAGWGPRFFTAKEADVPSCAMEHLNYTLLPGDNRRVTFFTHFEEDDRLTRIVMDELHYRWEVCQSEAGEWETCAGTALAELPSAPIAVSTPLPNVPQPYTIEIKRTSYDLWGRPRAENGCEGPYENKDPVRRFTMVTQVTNNSAQAMPEGWKPEFYTGWGKAPPSCIWNNDSTALEPRETRELTFFTHVEQDDWVSRAVVDTMNYLWTRQFAGED